MTWSRAPVAAALVAAFNTLDPMLNCFAAAPETFNPPALIVTDPASVTKRAAGMGVDQTELIVVAAVSLEAADDLDALMNAADRAIFADPTLGGVVLTSLVTEYRNYRGLQVAGATYRVADLAVRVDM